MKRLRSGKKSYLLRGSWELAALSANMGVEIIVTECSYNGGRFILAACYCRLVLRWEDSARDADFPCRTAMGESLVSRFLGPRGLPGQSRELGRLRAALARLQPPARP